MKDQDPRRQHGHLFRSGVSSVVIAPILFAASARFAPSVDSSPLPTQPVPERGVLSPEQQQAQEFGDLLEQTLRPSPRTQRLFDSVHNLSSLPTNVIQQELRVLDEPNGVRTYSFSDAQADVSATLITTQTQKILTTSYRSDGSVGNRLPYEPQSPLKTAEEVTRDLPQYPEGPQNKPLISEETSVEFTETEPGQAKGFALLSLSGGKSIVYSFADTNGKVEVQVFQKPQ